MEIVKNIIYKIGGCYNDSFMEDPEPIDSNEQDCEEQSFFSKLIEKISTYKKNKNESETKETNNKIYLNRNQAITITSLEKNLKKSLYNEAIDNGFNYGIIEFKDFYTTLVKYNGEIYWYVKVLDGKYGLKEEGKFIRGYFDEYSNIRCLINASSGKYIYINKSFDTSTIRMISDSEFLNIVLKFK